MNPGTLTVRAASETTLPACAPDLEDMVRRFGPRLLAVARRFVRNEADARDVVQDAFVAAFRSLGAFQGHSSPETWLHRIVVNAALMKLRTRRRRPECSIDDLLPTFLEDGHHETHIDDWQTPEALLGRRETQAVVRACIDRLPESYRKVLILRDVEELSTDEAAQALGISEGAVKLRLHRARLALRGLLAPHFGATERTLPASASPAAPHNRPGPAASQPSIPA